MEIKETKFNDVKDLTNPSPEEESRKRKRDGVLVIGIIILVCLLTFAESKMVHLGGDFPISNTILMFILLNINLLLLILLIFLVFRNLVKLVFDRRRKVMGAKLRTRLVVAFISLSLIPTIILFYFSIKVITTSIEFWYNVPVEQALENSLDVGRHLYNHARENSLFFLERTAYQVKTKKYLAPNKLKALSNYIRIVQREFNHDAVEIYSANNSRLTYAVNQTLENMPFPVISPETFKKEKNSSKAWTVSENTSVGEIIRTVGTVPFGASNKEIEAYIAITMLVSPELTGNLAAISRGVEEYQQIKLLKKPIKSTYYLALSIVALLVVFCAVWFGFYMAKSITIPIKELAEGTRKVAEGDLSFNIDLVADDEIGMLVDSFNRMTRDLRTGREQLELSAKMLHDQKDEIEARRQYMEIVLKNVSAGVISLDADGFVLTINKSAERMLDIKPDLVLKKNYNELLHGQHLNLATEVMEKIYTSRSNTAGFPLTLEISGRTRSFIVHFSALKDDSNRQMGIVAVFDDLTELQKAQRVAAWREVARSVAHEIKNPLTPISLSAQRLQRKYSKTIDDTVFNECTRTIIDHVDLIRNIVNEFSAFARFPGANPKPCDLLPIIEETISLYREGHTSINFKINILDDIPILNLDRRQIKRAMINLVDNAIAASNGSGSIAITLIHDPILKKVRLEIADTGKGISANEKTRLFEPYFSTKKTGMGLGLTIVSTIITDHNGFISAHDNQPKGAKFVIELPVS